MLASVCSVCCRRVENALLFLGLWLIKGGGVNVYAQHTVHSSRESRGGVRVPIHHGDDDTAHSWLYDVITD